MRGVILLAIVVLIGIGTYLSHHRSVEVTTCDTVLQTCTQTAYPVQSP